MNDNTGLLIIGESILGSHAASPLSYGVLPVIIWQDLETQPWDGLRRMRMLFNQMLKS